MEAAAPAAAETAGREELGGCCVGERARTGVVQGCTSAVVAEAPGLRLALAREASAGAWAAADPVPRPWPGLPRVHVACL